MRILGLIAVGLAGLSLSACSQISSIFKKKPHYHTADGTTVYTGETESLRTTPAQTYQFPDQNSGYTGGTEYVYASPASIDFGYFGRNVELFNAPTRQITRAYSDPRDAEFVSLNGESKIEDWRNCEVLNRGYLWISEYDFSLHPGFEVCMRNKGYVLVSEYGSSAKPTLSAQSARLRSGYSSTSSYSRF